MNKLNRKSNLSFFLPSLKFTQNSKNPFTTPLTCISKAMSNYRISYCRKKIKFTSQEK